MLCVLIQNVSCEPVCLELGAVLGHVQPVTIVSEAETAVKQIKGS